MAADVINRGAGSVTVGLFDEDEQSFVASATGSVKSQQVVPDLEIPVGFTVRTLLYINKTLEKETPWEKQKM